MDGKQQSAYDKLMAWADCPRDDKARDYLHTLFPLVCDDTIAKSSGEVFLNKLTTAMDEESTRSLQVDNLREWTNSLYLQCVNRGSIKRLGAVFVLEVFIVAYDQGFYDESQSLFEWVGRNIDGLKRLCQYSGHTRDLVASLLTTSSIPSCELLIRAESSDSPMVQQVQFDTESIFVRNLLMGAYRKAVAGRFRQHLIRSRVCELFTTSLGFIPSSLSEFTVATFTKQMEYFKQFSISDTANPSVSFLTSLYAYIIDELPEEQSQFTYETGLTQQMIFRPQFISEWANGYRAVIHNPMDAVPKSERWLLYPNQDELRNSTVLPRGYTVDVSYARDPRLQHLLASWLWVECENKMALRRLPAKLKELMDTFQIDIDNYIRVTSAGITRWLANLGKSVNGDGIRHYKSWVRSFISYGEAQQVLEVEQTVMLLLSMSERKKRWHADESTAADKDDLKKLATELEARSVNNLFDELIYCAFVVITLTPLRIGEVFALELDSLSENAGNIYSIQTSTKMDGSGRSEIQISNKVYKLLTAVIEMTDDVRAEAPAELANYLFIYKSAYKNHVIRLSGERFRKALVDTCTDIGLAPIGARSIRRRYETEVVLKGVEKNLSRLALKPLTGHASIDTTETHYVRDDVREYLEATYGIEIGVPQIRGAVVSNQPEEKTLSILQEENKVEDGAGYCRNAECNIPGTLTCLMCQGFVTTPSCIPEMEEMIANLQTRIRKNATNTHERDHLLAVKRLYVGYLATMYSVKEGKDNE